MRISARDLAVGDVVQINDWRLHVIRIDHDQTLAVLTVCRRAANFSLMNPAMETLFTVVSREDKYKAKNFIETFVYRFSDQLTVWAYAGLAALGLGLSGIAFVVAPVAGVSVALAIWLGRRQRQMERLGARTEAA